MVPATIMAVVEARSSRQDRRGAVTSAAALIGREWRQFDAK